MNHGYLPPKGELNFIIDNVTRDIETADAIIKGIQKIDANTKNRITYSIDGDVFNPVENLPNCTLPNNLDDLLRERISRLPKPSLNFYQTFRMY
eukprot:UN02290